MAFYSRGPNKVQKPYVLKDMYLEYIKDKEEGSPYYISYNKFVTICTMYYKSMAEYIKEGKLYLLPYKLGEVSVLKKKPKNMTRETMSLDWEQTQKLGKQVYHTNDHTNYYKYVFSWGKLRAHFKHKGSYRMVFTREHKRDLAKKIKSGEYDYFEID